MSETAVPVREGEKRVGIGRGKGNPQNGHGDEPLDTHQVRKPHVDQEQTISTQRRGTDLLVCSALPSTVSPREPSPSCQAWLGACSGLPRSLCFPNARPIWSVNFQSFIQQISVGHSTF